MNWQRARTEDKKNERKDVIYEAALTLFKIKGYENVSFNGIATEAGFTKSNMYRYFTSKEEIFLGIFGDLFKEWQSDCFNGLKNLQPNPAIEDFAQVWVDTYLTHPQFLDLIPILFTSLESNSSFDQLLKFKTLSMELLYQLAMEIGNIYPEIQIEKAFRFLTLSFAATSNYWAAESHQNDALNKIYNLEQFKDLKPDFKTNLADSIKIIINGLKATD